MSYSALHALVHGEILCTSYLLSFVWQVLAVAQGIDPLITDKRGHFRQGYFFSSKVHNNSYPDTERQVPQLAVVDAGHYFISPITHLFFSSLFGERA
jgi:hypothetical protein